jgi:hypothetical protein
VEALPMCVRNGQEQEQTRTVAINGLVADSVRVACSSRAHAVGMPRLSNLRIFHTGLRYHRHAQQASRTRDGSLMNTRSGLSRLVPSVLFAATISAAERPIQSNTNDLPDWLFPVVDAKVYVMDIEDCLCPTERLIAAVTATNSTPSETRKSVQRSADVQARPWTGRQTKQQGRTHEEALIRNQSARRRGAHLIPASVHLSDRSLPSAA